MAYDEDLAARIRAALDGLEVTEKKMFGGLAFMLRGHMCCGIVGDNLMLRVGPDGYEAALAKAHARPMDFTGKPMKGMIYVEPSGLGTMRALRGWLGRALEFVESLPQKPIAKPKPRARAKIRRERS